MSLSFPSSRKVKKRKSLESVLSTLLEGKVGNGSKEEVVVKTVAETGQQEAAEGGGEVGGARRDPNQQQRQEQAAGAIQKRKTLGKRARERAEASKLSVVDEEVSF